jgi:hypothetical protein
MARLTDKTLAQSTAITSTTLIHIVSTGDTSQNAAGSSYKAELNQIASTIGGYQYYSAITVTSAQTLTSFLSPVNLLPAPGANKYYDFKVYFEYTYGTTPYVSNPVSVVDNTGNVISNGINITPTQNVILVSNMNSATNNYSTVNSVLQLKTATANPTSGNGSLKIKIWYNIVNFG